MNKTRRITVGIATTAILMVGISACNAVETTPEGSPSSSSSSSPSSSQYSKEEVTPFTKNVVVSEHGIKVGSENADSKLQIVIDQQCPYCKSFSEDIEKELTESIDNGDVQVEYLIAAFMNEESPGGWSLLAANALNVVANSSSSSEHWLESYYAMYEHQPEAADDITTVDEAIETLEGVGVTFTEEEKQQMANNAYAQSVNEAENYAFSLGVEATPTVIANGTIEESMSHPELFLEFLETGEVAEQPFQ